MSLVSKCECCGASINQTTYKCDYCGTAYKAPEKPQAEQQTSTPPSYSNGPDIGGMLGSVIGWGIAGSILGRRMTPRGTRPGGRKPPTFRR